MNRTSMNLLALLRCDRGRTYAAWLSQMFYRAEDRGTRLLLKVIVVTRRVLRGEPERVGRNLKDIDTLLVLEPSSTRRYSMLEVHNIVHIRGNICDDSCSKRSSVSSLESHTPRGCAFCGISIFQTSRSQQKGLLPLLEVTFLRYVAWNTCFHVFFNKLGKMA